MGNNINYNPNLPPNDSLEPWEIELKANLRNAQTRDLTEKAYIAGGVPNSAAERAGKHSSTMRQTPEAKKDRRDARTWWEAKSWIEDDDDE